MKKKQAEQLIEEIRLLRNEVKELKDKIPYYNYFYPYYDTTKEWTYVPPATPPQWTYTTCKNDEVTLDGGVCYVGKRVAVVV